MKFAFDANIPPGMVKVFQMLLVNEDLGPVSGVVSAREYALPSDEGDDRPWVERFSEDGGSHIISGDKKMRGRPHELHALADEGMVVFFFAPRWSGRDFFVKSAMLLNWWPKILDVSINAPKGSYCEIPFIWNWVDLQMTRLPKRDG